MAPKVREPLEYIIVVWKDLRFRLVMENDKDSTKTYIHCTGDRL